MLRFSLVLDLESWGVIENLIPHVGKVILFDVSIKGWIAYPYNYGLLVCSGKALQRNPLGYDEGTWKAPL